MCFILDTTIELGSVFQVDCKKFNKLTQYHKSVYLDHLKWAASKEKTNQIQGEVPSTIKSLIHILKEITDKPIGLWAIAQKSLFDVSNDYYGPIAKELDVWYKLAKYYCISCKTVVL